jgi:hypothetical protein
MVSLCVFRAPLQRTTDCCRVNLKTNPVFAGKLKLPFTKPVSGLSWLYNAHFSIANLQTGLTSPLSDNSLFAKICTISFVAVSS